MKPQSFSLLSVAVLCCHYINLYVCPNIAGFRKLFPTGPVVVTASRTEKVLNEVPSSVVVVTGSQLEQENQRTLGDSLWIFPT